eukprot:SM000189S04118  [mRNA]  locus=s189:107297:107542:- [translate_table: standard]
MTTGTMDFITSSGRITPMDATPTPLLAVPYAAPMPAHHHGARAEGLRHGGGGMTVPRCWQTHASGSSDDGDEGGGSSGGGK